VIVKTLEPRANVRTPETDRTKPGTAIALQRAQGEIRLSFKKSGERSALDELYQKGCLKARLPRTPGGCPETVLINTSGGLTDGDRLSIGAEWHAGTSAVITTQACERIYKSRAAPARIETRLSVCNEASAFWLPQETILFDGGRLERRNHVALAGSAQLIACESVILGRPAMGETVRSGLLRDSWHIERDGKLIFADHLGLEENPSACLDRQAMGAGARAFASVIVCGPDSVRLRDRVLPLFDRLKLERPTVITGCSDLGGVLLARLLAPSGHELRAALIPLLQFLRGGDELPRVWTC
jgi:urease accessory protein